VGVEKVDDPEKLERENTLAYYAISDEKQFQNNDTWTKCYTYALAFHASGDKNRMIIMTPKVKLIFFLRFKS
jgi:hypothetical protein